MWCQCDGNGDTPTASVREFIIGPPAWSNYSIRGQAPRRAQSIVSRGEYSKFHASDVQSHRRGKGQRLVGRPRFLDGPNQAGPARSPTWRTSQAIGTFFDSVRRTDRRISSARGLGEKGSHTSRMAAVPLVTNPEAITAHYRRSRCRRNRCDPCQGVRPLQLRGPSNVFPFANPRTRRLPDPVARSQRSKKC